MSATSLQQLWEESASQPFQPSIGKSAQFTVGFTLLLIAFILTSLFGLSMSDDAQRTFFTCADHVADNSLKTLPLYGIPASLAFG